ncbi:uncharacterized protein MKZ38_007356 [Zalerion maritima]|uniref:Proteasome component ECM29 n=1 Tax=Zalerion maritima TaxID=339359 RepID=A0AAD5WVZ8_9PEZI|nr:uncharacterized protein MKZ38_007356 [Zalerion maritima]
MATPEAPSEERELQLIEKLEFRIILHSNDENKLQDTLDRYLKALLLKAESPHESVRTKTVAVAQRVNGYIKPTGIVLPVKALLEQFKTTASPRLKTLDLMFIQHSLPRLSPVDRRELAPELIRGMSKERYPSIGSSLFNAVLRVLPDIKIPPRGSPEDDTFREAIGLEGPEDAKFLASWFSKLMILKPSGETPSEGVSKDDYDFLTRNRGAEAWNIDSPIGLALPPTRVLVINFLTSGAFKDDEKFIPAIWAAGSQDSRVASAAEAMLKRSGLSMEDPELVGRLFEMHVVANRPVRTRIMEALSKSAISSTNRFSDAILAAVHKNMNELVAFSQPNPHDATQDNAKPGALAKREHVKLASATLSYMSWAAKVGTTEEGYQLGMPLLSSVYEYLESLGWPVPHVSSRDDDSLRGQVYEVLGSLARTAKLTMDEKIIWAQRLFKSLAEDPTPEVVVSIEGALSSMGPQFAITRPAFSSSEDVQMGGTESPDAIRRTLRHYMNVDETEEQSRAVRNTRYAVTKFVNDCLPADDIEARWINILALAGRQSERGDVVEEGRRGLDLWNHSQRAGGTVPLPRWNLLADFMLVPTEASDFRHGLAQSSLDHHFLDTKYHGQRKNAIPAALVYCKNILLASALPDFKVERHWEAELDRRVKNSLEDREQLRNYIRDLSDSPALRDSLRKLLLAGLEGTLTLQGKAQEECISTFVEIASISPTILEGEIALSLLPLVRSNSELLRNTAARAVGIVAPQPTVSIHNLEQHFLEPLLKLAGAEGAVGSEQNSVEGALRAIGYVLANRKYYVPGPLQTKTISTLDTLSSKWNIERLQPSMKNIALDMLADLWTASIPIGLSKQEPDSSGAADMIKKLLPEIKKKNERAIKALGRLCIALDDELCSEPEETAMSAMEALLGLTDIKEVGVHLAIGEALAVAAARWDSTSVALGLDVRVDAPLAPEVPSRVAFLLNKLLEVAKSTKPSILKAYGIWLFSLIQHCSKLKEIQGKFRECQGVFMRLLSARDELVQETASRGLSLVFEKGDEELRKTLVSDLTAVFTGDAKDRMKVSEESEVFGAGDLETEDGKSITSYKDVVNLASEAGDPSLVYKLMNMSLHAATWSTRSAFGRFGLGNILSEAPLPPTLYAKLYRYKYDPVSAVRKSMTDIWNAAVKDSTETIIQNFDLIMRELLDSMFAREWRTREASCSAIEDLVSGRPFKEYQQYYDEIWTRAIKVLDDKKSTVRTSALKLCMGLSKSLVTQLETNPESNAAKGMMESAIPFLLSNKALGSNVEEVFAVSASTLIKIAKHGSKGINPFVPTIITELLGVMSTSESEVINHSRNKYGGDMADKIDKMRTAYSTKSPLWEAIENSLRNADKSVIADLMPKLEDVIKTSLGLPTKLGCSHLIVALVTRHAADFRPYVAGLLKLMRKQIFDKNDEVARAYARASAYLFKIAKPKSREIFVNHLVETYFQSESESPRRKVADMLESLSNVASDQFKTMEALVLPLVFVGKHDIDETVRRTLSGVWENNVGSNRTVARILEETVVLIDRGLETTQWALRHGGALATASVIEALSSSLTGADQIPTKSAEEVWPVLEKSLSLKTFEGKEKVFDAFVLFVANCTEFWSSDSKKALLLQKIAIREAKRNNVDYKIYAVLALSRFAAARKDLDMLDEICQISTPSLEDLKDEGAASGGTGQKQIQLAKACVESISGGYNRVALKNEPSEVLGKILDTLLPYLENENLDTVRPAWYQSVGSLMAETMKSTSTKVDASGSLLVLYSQSLVLDVSNGRMLTMDVRIQRARAFAELVKVAMEGPLKGGVSDSEKREMEGIGNNLLGGERAMDVRTILRTAIAQLEV